MVPTRVFSSVFFLLLLGVSASSAGPTSHAMELSPDGSLFIVDIDNGRLLRLAGAELTIYSSLQGVPPGDHLQNLVLTPTGELFLGEKKAVWKVAADGSVNATKPPAQIKSLFIGRPGDLAPDGSIYVARDFRNISRSLPGGDSHPVLTTDTISKIHSMSVTPYGRVYFGNTSEVAKLNAQGEVEILVDLQGQAVMGLAAEGENAVLLLRRNRDGKLYLERIDIFGNAELLLTSEDIAAVTTEHAVTLDTTD